jgi:hypothetical protein
MRRGAPEKWRGMNSLHNGKGRCLGCSGTGGVTDSIEVDMPGGPQKIYAVIPCPECIGANDPVCPQCGTAMAALGVYAPFEDVDNDGYPRCTKCGWQFDEKAVWA